MADSSEALLQRQQAELAGELARTYRGDVLLAAVIAALCAGVLWFIFGRPCLRGDSFLGHVWCAQVGPWSYTRLVLLLAPNLAVTAPLTFNGLRRRRRRRFWAF